ncbi:MAG: RIP metalloprotease RseP [Candidatus Melainabacteria bacterium]|nr:RIP metalloprotease RseP [Candidatus Melainabacteria bacterium]
MPLFTMLALLSLLIIAHELGHFAVARWCGVRVERFGLGLPIGPTLWSKKVGDTEYCLHPLLLGGYVSFPDDSEDSDVPLDSPQRFENQPVWNRIAIALAGIAVNAVLALALMTAILLAWGIPSQPVRIQSTLPTVQMQTIAHNKLAGAEQAMLLNLGYSVRLTQPNVLLSGLETPARQMVTMARFWVNTPGSALVLTLPAAAPTPTGDSKAQPTLQDSLQQAWLVQAPAGEAGLLPGDEIIAVNHEPLEGYFDQRWEQLTAQVKRHRESVLPVTVRRLNGQVVTVDLKTTSDGLIGIRRSLSKETRVPTRNPLLAMRETCHFMTSIVSQNFQAMGLMLTGQVDPKYLAGPIKIVDTGAKLIEISGIEVGLRLTAMISMILAVMNLLPIPPLDGGLLMFLLIEAIKGQPVSKRWQERVTQVGFVGLAALMVFVIFNDIYNTFIQPVF